MRFSVLFKFVVFIILLQLEQTAGSSVQRRTGNPGLSLVSPKVFSLFCHRWSFGSLPLSPLACLVWDTSFPAILSTWLHRYYLNWTELDDAITQFNNEMPLTENWVLNLVILHYWYYFPILILCSCFVTICIVKSFLSKCLLWMRKCRKSYLIRIFIWRTKVSEAVCKHDWHNMRSYLFFNYIFGLRITICTRGHCTLFALSENSSIF